MTSAVHLINACASRPGGHLVGCWSLSTAAAAGPRCCLVDETSMRKRHRYVTVIVNGDTGRTLAMVQHRNVRLRCRRF